MFYYSAKQRFADGQFLLAGGRTTAAVYLAGYGVECILKVLILASVRAKDCRGILASFRGARAHDFEWLKYLYLDRGAPPFPPDVARPFALVNSWSTDMRYLPGTVRRRDAVAFLAAAQQIITWADGRF